MGSIAVADLFSTMTDSVLLAALEIAILEPWGMSILLIILPAMITAGPITRGPSNVQRAKAESEAQLVARLRTQVRSASPDGIRAPLR